MRFSDRVIDEERNAEEENARRERESRDDRVLAKFVGGGDSRGGGGGGGRGDARGAGGSGDRGEEDPPEDFITLRQKKLAVALEQINRDFSESGAVLLEDKSDGKRRLGEDDARGGDVAGGGWSRRNARAQHSRRVPRKAQHAHADAFDDDEVRGAASGAAMTMMNDAAAAAGAAPAGVVYYGAEPGLRRSRTKKREPSRRRIHVEESHDDFDRSFLSWPVSRRDRYEELHEFNASTWKCDAKEYVKFRLHTKLREFRALHNWMFVYALTSHVCMYLLAAAGSMLATVGKPEWVVITVATVQALQQWLRQNRIEEKRSSYRTAAAELADAKMKWWGAAR